MDRSTHFEDLEKSHVQLSTPDNESVSDQTKNTIDILNEIKGATKTPVQTIDLEKRPDDTTNHSNEIFRKSEQKGGRLYMRSWKHNTVNGRLFSQEQLTGLKSDFVKNPYPSREEFHNLAQKLKMKEKSVRMWFQNRRSLVRKGNKNEMKQSIQDLATEESLKFLSQQQQQQQQQQQNQRLMQNAWLIPYLFGMPTMNYNNQSFQNTVMQPFYRGNMSENVRRYMDMYRSTIRGNGVSTEQTVALEETRQYGAPYGAHVGSNRCNMGNSVSCNVTHKYMLNTYTNNDGDDDRDDDETNKNSCQSSGGDFTSNRFHEDVQDAPLDLSIKTPQP